MTLTLRYAARSDVGLIRSNNQDAVFAGPRLLAVADGMGGHAAGDVASSVTIAALAPLDDDVPPADLVGALDRAIRQANDTLRDMTLAEPELEGMGTTVTALLASGHRLALAHVGDSRAYLLRGGTLQQITRDHSLVQDYIDEGRLTEEEAKSHPQRSLLTRALDGSPGIEIDLSMREARAGDRFLLCTDGLSGVVSNETLAAALARGDPEECVEQLVALALRGGAPDNVTCVVADVLEADTSASEEPVIGGSASATTEVRGDPRSAAERAAALTPRPTDDEPQAPPAKHRRWRGPLLVVLLIAVVGGAIFGGTWWYAQGQYYVGAENGHVTIYRGINGNLAGFSFSSVAERTDVPIDSLSAFERDKVQQTITAHSLAAAERIVDQLRDGATTPGGDQSGSIDTGDPSASPSAPAGTPSAAPPGAAGGAP